MNCTKKILIFICYLIANQSFGCDCKELGPLDSLRRISYNQSDIVFLGELMDFDTLNNTYKFRIIELFKGKSYSLFIRGKYFDTCSKFPKDKCTWIIYANYYENDYIDINNCLASRSELNPLCPMCYDPPPALGPKASESDIKQSEEIFLAMKQKAMNDWLNEIDLLRNGQIR